MAAERSGATRQAQWMAMVRRGWQASFLLGLITAAFGVVVMLRPTHSLIGLAVLLGIVMIVSGVFHIVRALDSAEHQRLWRGIAGMLAIVTGLILLRHLGLSLAFIGLFIGFTWVIQGISSLIEGFSRGLTGSERVWSVLFGAISLAAGIVIISAPLATLTTLAFLAGAWFIVIGVLEMAGAFVARRAVREHEQVSVPGQRAGTAASDSPAASRKVPR